MPRAFFSVWFPAIHGHPTVPNLVPQARQWLRMATRFHLETNRRTHDLRRAAAILQLPEDLEGRVPGEPCRCPPRLTGLRSRLHCRRLLLAYAPRVVLSVVRAALGSYASSFCTTYPPTTYLVEAVKRNLVMSRVCMDSMVTRMTAPKPLATFVSVTPKIERPWRIVGRTSLAM